MFLWMGDARRRLFRGVAQTKPDEVHVAINSQSPGWRELQEEGFRELKSTLGETYRDSIYPVVFEDDTEEKAIYSRVIANTYHNIWSLRKMHQELEVIWDITAAPTGFVCVIGLMASLLSTEDCKMIIQYVRRKNLNDPILHAATSSEYLRNHKNDADGACMRPLSDFREREALDEGAEVHQMTFPMFSFDLFEETAEGQAKRALFLRIPNSGSQMVKISDVKKTMEADARESRIMLLAAEERTARQLPRNIKNETSSRQSKKKDVTHSMEIWYSTTVQRLGDVGLVKWERRGLHLWCKRTYAGDLFTPALYELYNQRLSAQHSENGALR